MAKCAICEKAAHFGNNVSHSHRRSNAIWKANVKSVKVKVNGGAKKMYVCTACLRSGLVERAELELNAEDMSFDMSSFSFQDFCKSSNFANFCCFSHLSHPQNR